jgi:hypothetical protein
VGVRCEGFRLSADNVFSTLDLQLECHAVQLDCNILSKLDYHFY